MKLAVALLTLSLVVSLGGGAAAQVDPCLSTAVLNGAAPYCFFSCPTGDGLTPLESGWLVNITVLDADTIPIPDIPETDFWLEDCALAPQGMPIAPCGGGMGAITADGSTDEFGTTRFANRTFLAGGCGYDVPSGGADALRVIVQGVPLQSSNCTGTILCLPVRVRSPDISGDGLVALSDLSSFAQALLHTHDPCADFACDDAVGLTDLAAFSGHFREAHACP